MTLAGRLRLRATLILLRLAQAVTGVVPRLAAEPLCRLAGIAWWAVSLDKREAVRANLTQILARAPRAVEVIRVFQGGVLNYWDTFAIPQLTPDDVLRLVDVRGLDHLDTALQRGKGVILAGAHLSSVALAGQVVASRGHPVVAVVEPIEPRELFDYFATIRGAQGIRMLPAGVSAARDLLMALRRNEIVGLVSDRNVLGTGLSVPFIGAETTFTDGPAALSVRTGAPILVGVAVRKAGGRFDAWIESPIEVDRTGDVKEDVRALTRVLAERLGYHIASHPEQWTVFQRRWPVRAR